MSAWTLVTGGAKGLGAAICKKLAQEKKNIVIHYHTHLSCAKKVALECQKEGVQAEILRGDFTSQEKAQIFIEEYLERFSNTENLINNVGNYLIKKPLETSLVEWKELFQINFFAPLLFIQALVPSLKKHQGSILNVGVAGLFGNRADLHATAYTLSKQALYGLTLSLAKEFASVLIRVNMISPGYLENSINLPKVSTLPMGRAGTLEEVACLAAFLLSEKGRYLTGQNIEIAGGVRL